MDQRKIPASEEMPIGLMAQMTQNTRAMNGFFSLSGDVQQGILDNIRCAPNGEEAKSRIEHTLNALQSMEASSAFDHDPR